MNKETFDLNDDLKEILHLFENSKKHLFITGKAGTGKSSLINYIRKRKKKNFIILAPTAIAALQVHGKTIHSFFNLPFHIVTKNDIKKHYNKRLINKLDTIIIDEVSMLRPDILDAIDITLQKTRGNTEPFGGIQIVLVGDLYQLPPVITNDEIPIMDKLYPDGHFFFNSYVMQNLELTKFELSNIFRQTDLQLIELLDKARNSLINNSDLKVLNQRMMDESDTIPDNTLVLSPRNDSVNKINSYNLSSISSKEYSYEADIDGNFSGNPVDQSLKLKVGAQVIIVKNGINWVNGTLATIHKLTNNEVHIKIKEEVYKLEKEKWEKYEYTISKEKIIPTVSATFIQYPIKLAWAATIHKCQGQTFANIVLDMGQGAFAHGQTYVALSRVISLEGLYLRRPLQINDFIFNEKIREFLVD